MDVPPMIHTGNPLIIKPGNVAHCLDDNSPSSVIYAFFNVVQTIASL